MMRTDRPMIVGSQRSNSDEVASDRGRWRRSTSFVCCLTAFCAAVSALVAVSPAAARPTATFVSKLYRYSIVLPGATSRWYLTFATRLWLGASIPGIADPQLDTFTDSKTGRTYLLAARPTGSSLEKWTKFVIAARPSICIKPTSPKKATLAGEPAEMVTWSCADQYRVIVITALHAGRGYFMLQASPTTLARASDLPAFNAARQSFRFSR
jgi:hypothetical protein